jgi:peptidoglycan/LPS O-acetylase OafA/YrhL
MPEPVEGTSSYVAGLDGLRAIAVLSVIAYHLNFGWAQGGLLGVGVFFVLSGYLITDLLASQFHRHGGIGLTQFWGRRARRLLPALFLMLFVVVGWVTLFDRMQLAGVRSDLPAAVFYVSNWWFIFHHVSYFASFGPPSPLGHLWSLAIEEQFYLVWPLVILAGLRWALQGGRRTDHVRWSW